MPIVDLETPVGRHLLVNSRAQATSILVDNKLALNYDCEGRLTGAWMDGRNYRKGLDNRILEKQGGSRSGLFSRLRRELDPGESRHFLDQVHDLLVDFSKDIKDPSTRITNQASPSDRAAVSVAIDNILANDLSRLDRDSEAFHHIYKPITILPPDQYMALVLQATEGCTYNRCTFCGFYRDRSFRVKPVDEFRQHIQAVKAFFGRAICLRKSIFLADANALVIPQEQLIPLMDLINDEFPMDPPLIGHEASSPQEGRPKRWQGIYSFVDAFTTRRKTAQDFAELAARGLRRVYVGLESGDAELLKFLGKPNSPEDALNLVRQVKAGGVAVGIIILAGAGGEKFSTQHVRETAQVVNAMPLDGHDLVYFSALVDYPGSKYGSLAAAAGIQPMSIEQIEGQMAQMRATFRFQQQGRAPKISYYDVREFIY